MFLPIYQSTTEWFYLYTNLLQNVSTYIPNYCRRLESSVTIFICWSLGLLRFTPNKTFPPQAWILSLLPSWHRQVRYVKITNAGTRKTKVESVWLFMLCWFNLTCQPQILPKWCSVQVQYSIYSHLSSCMEDSSGSFFVPNIIFHFLLYSWPWQNSNSIWKLD